MRSTRIAVAFHSGYGHTARLAQAVRDGAAGVDGAFSLLLSVEEAQRRWSELEAVDAIVFGAPTYMGSVSAGFKAFQEASSRAVMSQGFRWSDKLAAGFTSYQRKAWWSPLRALDRSAYLIMSGNKSHAKQIASA